MSRMKCGLTHRDLSLTQRWNHMSKATDIQACIQANVMGADEALMLDDRGYVKTCNSTNFMIVREGTGVDQGRLVIWSPTKNNQMQGITRRRTIEVAREAGIPVYEIDFSLTEVYGAAEVSQQSDRILESDVKAFCTGTFPAQMPVIEVDGRVIGDGKTGPLTLHLQSLYAAHVKADIQRGREAVRQEIAEADLPWALRYPGKI